MTIKVAFDIADSAIESGIDIQRIRYNAVNPELQIGTVEEFAAKLALDGLETYKMAAADKVREKIAKLDIADLVAIEPTIDAAIAAKAPPVLEPPIKVQP